MHRLQHAPQHARRGKRHTSIATLAVLADPVPSATATPAASDLRTETMRGRGRGGQRRNKVETAVRLRHLPTGTTITRTSGRSQAANLTSARAELEEALHTRDAQHAAAEANRQRRIQATHGTPGGAFTHSVLRGQVTNQLTGQSWSLRAWQQGRFGDSPVQGPAPSVGRHGPAGSNGFIERGTPGG